jgi:hypothetical protein
MKQPRSILFLMFAACAVLPAATASMRYAITAERIAEAVSMTGAQVVPEQVILPATIVASVPYPRLSVKSIDRTGDERATARLECAIPEQCLPFIVTLRMTADPSVESSHGRSTAILQSKASPPAVRAGSPATLLLEGAHVHITISVICLESGAPGKTIRATDRDRRQVYTAQVVRDGLLEGRL